MTMTPAPNEPAQTLIRKRMLLLLLKAKAPARGALCGEPLVACLPLQKTVPPSLNKLRPSVALGSSQRRMPKLEIRPGSRLPSKSMYVLSLFTAECHYNVLYFLNKLGMRFTFKYVYSSWKKTVSKGIRLLI